MFCKSIKKNEIPHYSPLFIFQHSFQQFFNTKSGCELTQIDIQRHGILTKNKVGGRKRLFFR